MKPRRTVESVVDELIEGLRSGEVVLGYPAAAKTFTASIGASVPNASYSNALASQALREFGSPFYPTFARLNFADMEVVTSEEALKGFSSTPKRLWLFVARGEYSTYHFLSKITIHHKDFRVLLTPEAVPLMAQFLADQGWTTKNVRVMNEPFPSADLMALSDTAVIWGDRGFADHIISKVWIENSWETIHDGYRRIEKQSNPDRFHDIEELYTSWWESAKHKA